MTRCVVCGRSCIPLADYDRPTCITCGAAMDAVLERAALTPERVPVSAGSDLWDELRREWAEAVA